VARWCRCGLSVSGPFVRRCSEISLASPCFRFHIPLIEPDGRISRFRLSEKVHDVAHGRWRGRLLRRTRPSTLCREALENRLVPDVTLCLAHNH
jgi:hypothetical protein